MDPSLFIVSQVYVVRKMFFCVFKISKKDDRFPGPFHHACDFRAIRAMHLVCDTKELNLQWPFPHLGNLPWISKFISLRFKVVVVYMKMRKVPTAMLGLYCTSGSKNTFANV